MSSVAEHPWKGQWAVVTGASSGIGRAIAHQLAEEGVNLVLTSRRKAVHALSPVEIESISLDLEDRDAPRQLFEFTESKSIKPALLVNNAGFGVYGEFRKMDLARQLALVQVNCAAVVALTSLYLPGMIERRKGDVLIVSSTAAFQGVPYQATYAASKAFDLIFAESIAEEVERFGVRVCALCPGQTKSEFHEVANEPIPKGMSIHSAEEVAKIGLDALRAGKHYVISGLSNRMGMEVQRLLPRRLVTKVSERMFRPGS